MEDICEMELREGLSQPVEGSCVSKPVEDCGPETRFEEEFVEEEVCSDFQLKIAKMCRKKFAPRLRRRYVKNLRWRSAILFPMKSANKLLRKFQRKSARR